MRITKEIQFDAGHRVPHHGGKCASPHGHRYRVAVTVLGLVINDNARSDNGMVIDFGDIKEALTKFVHDPYDHAMIIWDEDDDLLEMYESHPEWKVALVEDVPTAENLAQLFWDVLTAQLAERGIGVCSVEVWETPTSSAKVG